MSQQPQTTIASAAVASRPTIQINTHFNPQYSDSEDQDQQELFGGDSSDEDGGLLRALPSNKLTWDSVRHYASVITSRSDVLNGLMPPQATFYDHQDLVEAHSKKSPLVAQTPQNIVGKTKAGPFPTSTTALSPSSSGPPNTNGQSSIAEHPTTPTTPPTTPHQFEQPPPASRTRRNTLRASTTAFVKQQIDSTAGSASTTLTLLRTNSAHAPNNDDVPPPPPPLQNELDLIKPQRRSSIGYDVPTAVMVILPPPPDEVEPAPVPATTRQQQQQPDDEMDLPPPGRLPAPYIPATHSDGDKISPLLAQAPMPQINTNNANGTTSPQVQRLEGQNGLTPADRRARRANNMSRTEEDMMSLYLKPGSSQQPTHHQSPQKQSQQQQQQQQQQQSQQPPPSPRLATKSSSPIRKMSQPQIPVGGTGVTMVTPTLGRVASPTKVTVTTTLLPPDPKTPAVTTSSQPVLPSVSAVSLLALYKSATGTTADIVNQPQNGIYAVPDLKSLVKLGLILAFGTYSIDTYIDDTPGELPQPPSIATTKLKLKLDPNTYSVAKLLEPYHRDLAESPIWSEFCDKLYLPLLHIPFEITSDLHPRSFGLVLLLAAATSQVNQPTLAAAIDHPTAHYQQCAAFFLVVALITKVGVQFPPKSLLPPSPNQNPQHHQEDVLFYLSLLTDQMDYQRLYSLYNKHNPLTAVTKAAQPIKAQSMAKYNGNRNSTVEYGILPQIEHQTGLQFYLFAQQSDQAYQSYQTHLTTLPQTQHNSITPPQYLSQTDCYIVGYMLWLKAAIQDYAPAISDVSWARYSGYGIHKNFDLAFHWVYRAASIGGDGRAMNNLGLYYKKGIGAQRPDIPRAFFWLHRAKLEKYPSLSTKTLQILEKQLNLIGVEPHNNPYLDPKYGQLEPGSVLVPLDTWDDWIENSEHYVDANYDVTNTTGLYTQSQRVDIAYQTTAHRLQHYPPLVFTNNQDGDVPYNAAMILAMIPRPVVANIASRRRASLGKAPAQITATLITPAPIPHAQTTPMTTTTLAIEAYPPQPEQFQQPPTTPLPPVPPQATLPLPPVPPQQQLPLPQASPYHHAQSTLSLTTNLPQAPAGIAPTTPRASVFAQRKASIALNRPQTFTLSQQDIQALQQQQQQIHQDHLMQQQQQQQQHQPYSPVTQHSTILKTPIRANADRILATDILLHSNTNAVFEDNQVNVTIQSPAPTLSRLESAADPVSAYRAQQSQVREQTQAKYLQQDAIPPPPPPPEDSDDYDNNEGGDVFRHDNLMRVAPLPHPQQQQQHTTHHVPKIVPISIDPNYKPPSNTPQVVVQTFDPITNSFVDDKVMYNTSTPRNGTGRPSVVAVPAPTPTHSTPGRVLVSFNQVPNTTLSPTHSGSSGRQSVSSTNSPQHQAPLRPIANNQQQRVNNVIPEDHAVDYDPDRTSFAAMSVMSNNSNIARRSISYSNNPHNDRTSSGSLVLINVSPIQRAPNMTPEDWTRLTKQHYRQTLAKMMNLTRDGYITRIEHLNQLAELRVLYGLTPDHHQTEYHLCKGLFDQREKQETDKWNMIVDRKKQMSTLQKTMRLQKLEEDLAQQKAKEAAEGPRAAGQCLSCKMAVATEPVQPCQHVCVCLVCSRKLKKCPYCGGKAAPLPK